MGNFGLYGVVLRLTRSNHHLSALRRRLRHRLDHGNIVWHYKSQSAIPVRNTLRRAIILSTSGVDIADGKVYTYNTEHTTSKPITQRLEAPLHQRYHRRRHMENNRIYESRRCRRRLPHSLQPYDGYMYVFGKGKSATTVTAPDTAVAKGHRRVDTGHSRWISLQALSLGTPCVSAASMATQMEYLYMQHPIDGLYHNETITGVPVN